MPRDDRLALLGPLVVLASLLGGCASFSSMEAGASYAIAKPHQSAAALNLAYGAGLGDETAGVGAGGELRTKLGPNMGRIAIGPLLYGYGAPEASVVAPYVRLGFDLLQFESVEGAFAFGMFSPHAQAGVLFRVARRVGLSVGIDGEYVVRFTDTPNTGYASLMLGVVGIESSTMTFPRVAP